MKLNLHNRQIVLADSSAQARLSANELVEWYAAQGISLTLQTAQDGEAVLPQESPLTYSIWREGEEVCIAASTLYGWRAALDAITQGDALNRLPLYHVAVPQTPALAYREAPQDAVRVMFYNHHGQLAGLCGPVDWCEQFQIELFTLYRPDVLALQEFTPWRSAQPGCLGDRLAAIGYTRVDGGYADNFTPLFYRTDTLELVDSGFELFPEYMNDQNQPDPNGAYKINNGKSKSLTWAVFEQRSSGKRFIAVSTHFMYIADLTDTECPLTAEQSEAAQLIDAARLLAVLDELHARPEYSGLPVIAGGDLNAFPDSAPVNALQAGGLTWLSAPGAVENLLEDGHCGYPTFDTEKGIYTAWGRQLGHPELNIDHAFVQGSLTVQSYVTVTDRGACYSSDHCPKIADFILN